MARPKQSAPKKTRGDERRKTGKRVRVRLPLLKQLNKLTERNLTDLADEVNRAVRLLLEQEGLWPPI
jgi:hypothetical protein